MEGKPLKVTVVIVIKVYPNWRNHFVKKSNDYSYFSKINIERKNNQGLGLYVNRVNHDLTTEEDGRCNCEVSTKDYTEETDGICFEFNHGKD